mgnify:CR=1 FL=1
MSLIVAGSPLLLAFALPPEAEAWGTITVAAAAPQRVLPPDVELSEDALVERQPRSAAEALEGLAGVSARTNSRGETIARVRGAEERQTQVFLDGAPLAVPWDGRADLGIVPAGLIGVVRVVKGAAPIEFGANAVAGAVDFQTRSGGPRNLRLAASAGTLGFGDATAVATLPLGAFDFTFAAAAVTRDAEPVADPDALPFSETAGDGRLNTALVSATLFAAARWQNDAVSVRAYLLHLDASRGIAPESDRDPAEATVRYWRYPAVAQTQASVTASADLAQGMSVKLVAWRQWFGQRIEQFASADFDRVVGGQRDWDDTTGGRLLLAGGLGAAGFRIVATAQTSRHAQIDSRPDAGPGPRLVFRQNLYTLGGELDAPVGPMRATFGIAYDRSTNPLTGDKPAQPAKDALALSAALRAPLADGLGLTLSAGRRSRFPSARELFGEALGRFVPNPQLRPEQAWLADAELRFTRPGVTLAVNPFLVRSEDTIAQQVVTVGGRRLRQRINLEGATSFGLDVTGTFDLAPTLELELAASLLDARADRGTAPFRRLPQRPQSELFAALDWMITDAVELRAEARRVGEAVDLAADGSVAHLAPGTEFNVRMRWGVATIGDGGRLSLVGSVDNLANDVITPQLGLPLPGRTFRIGFQLS